MKPLILVKHSLAEIVADIPAREWNLSEEGRERARKLAEILRQYQPEVILSSKESKALQTAERIAECLGMNFHAGEDLHEHDRSNMSYLSKKQFQNHVREFFERPNTLVFGNETASQALSRYRKAIDCALKVREAQTAVVVSHGTVIALYVAWLTGCDGYDLWQKLGLPSFVVLDTQTKRLLEVINLP